MTTAAPVLPDLYRWRSLRQFSERYGALCQQVRQAGGLRKNSGGGLLGYVLVLFDGEQHPIPVPRTALRRLN